MEITIEHHSLNQLRISYTGDQSDNYEITVFDVNNNIIAKHVNNNLKATINTKFNTGHYVINVKSNKKTYTVHSVVPAICRLSSGGCGVLISGYQLGISNPFLLTANHCIPDKKTSTLIEAHFERASIKLDPNSYWIHSERYKNGGIDYSCIGLSDESIKRLRRDGIYPHELSTEAFLYKEVGFLTHFNHINGNKLLKTLCIIVNREEHCARYQYANSFPSSSGGSSGSPVFGFNTNNSLTVQGLHIGHGKCTLAGSILADMKAKSISAH